LRTAKILGTENAKTQTSKSTSIIKTSASPYAENAGEPSQKRTSNGKKTCGTEPVTAKQKT
jgi:hypothetical protein